MEGNIPVLSLLLITGLAAIVPLFASRLRRLRIPIVVGEILAGIIVGRSGFNLIQDSSTLEFLSTFGFTYLMFLSGLEVDFASITQRARNEDNGRFSNPMVLAVVVFGLTLGAGLLVALGLQQTGLVKAPLVMALILSTTSLGIVVPVLKERNLTSTRYGQSLLLTALVADFATLLLISVVVAALSRGLSFDLLLILLLLAVFVVFANLGSRISRLSWLRQLIDELSHATAQIKVRGAFALMVGFMVVAQGVGTEIILGAFLAGAVVSLLSDRDGSNLHMKMDAIGFGFFIPIFFIMVGVRFDLPALFSSSRALLLVPALILVAYVIKFLAVLLYRFDFSWRHTFAAGAILSSRLSLIIAAAAISLDLGIIDEGTNAAVILVAIVTCTVSPILFNRLLPPHVEAARKGIILAGVGEMSALLANRLHRSGEKLMVVGTDKRRADELTRRGLPVLHGNPADPDVLEAAGAADALSLVAMTALDEVNMTACRLAREKFGIPHRIALVREPAVARELADQGTRIIQPQAATLLALEGALFFPAAFDMLTDTTDGVEVRETVLSNRRMDGRPLRHVRLPGDVLLLGLRREGDVLVPHGDTVLRQGDVLMLVGPADGLQDAIQCINPFDSA